MGERRELVERVAEWSCTRFASRAAGYDAEAALSIENFRDLHTQGLLGLTVPRAYGGLGVDPLTEPMSHHPLVQRSIAEMATSLRAGRLFVTEAARLKASGDRPTTALAINQAKYVRAEVGTS